jgi:HEAT repeat protein
MEDSDMKLIRLQVWKVMTVTLLSLLSPLTLSQKSLALNCNGEEVNFFVEEQLKIKLNQKKPVNQEVKNDQLETIKQWGGFLYPELRQEDVMCALIHVLNDQYLPPELRSQAADVLGGIGTEAESAKPYLLIAFKDNNLQVRRSAIEAVRKINAKGTVDYLIKALDAKDSDSNVKRAAVGALGSTKKEAKKAVPQLIKLLETDPNGFVRQDTAEALINITLTDITLTDAGVKVALNKTVQNDSAWFVRNKVIEILDKKENTEVVDIDSLIPLVNDKNYTLRTSVFALLTKMSNKAEQVLPKLIDFVKNENNDIARQVAVEAIGSIGKVEAIGNINKKEEEAVKVLINLIQTDSSLKVRTNAVEALSEIDPYTSSSRQELIKFLQDENEDLRVSASVGLGNIATFLQDQYQSQKETEGLPQAITDLDNSKKAMESASQLEWQNKEKKETFLQQQDIITRKLNFLKGQQGEAFRQWWLSSITNPYIGFPLVIFSGLFLTYLLVFWIFPLWLLKIDEQIWKTASEVHPLAKVIVSILSFFLFLKYHPRVLDRWVEKHLKKVHDDFLNKPTVQHHKMYVPLPVQLDSGDNITTIEQLTSQDFKESFPGNLLIWGESGVGKTSIACQIAQWSISDNKEERLCKHRMLPVLISENIEMDNSGEEKPFLAAIRGQLESAIKEESISPELLKHLLEKSRILVVVDHLSEMSEATRKLIRHGQPDFYVHALVVTSRQKESLGSVLTIKPSQLTASQISTFLETYLVKQGVRQLFTDKELHENCANLSQIVGQRNITPMFVKLYAEQLRQKKVKVAQELTLPNNIPELMIKYLDELNREIKEENRLEDRTVDKDAESLAWICLKDTYQPSEIMHSEALVALEGNDAEERLEYLEEKLHLIQTNQISKDKIHFVLEPLAEYLAAWHLVNLYIKDQNQEEWQKFLEKFDSVPKAFVIAVRDCCEARAKEVHLPQLVIEKLNQVNGKSPSN